VESQTPATRNIAADISNPKIFMAKQYNAAARRPPLKNELTITPEYA